MSNSYWREMVKDAINCDDIYADILLEFQYQVSNGIDTSEASFEELKKYWQYIDWAYKDTAAQNYLKHINQIKNTNQQKTGESNVNSRSTK